MSAGRGENWLHTDVRRGDRHWCGFDDCPSKHHVTASQPQQHVTAFPASHASSGTCSSRGNRHLLDVPWLGPTYSFRGRTFCFPLCPSCIQKRETRASCAGCNTRCLPQEGSVVSRLSVEVVLTGRSPGLEGLIKVFVTFQLSVSQFSMTVTLFLTVAQTLIEICFTWTPWNNNCCLSLTIILWQNSTHLLCLLYRTNKQFSKF